MVQNIGQLERKLLRKIPDAVRREVRATMAKYADKIVATMKRLVPVEYGDLRDSIGWVWGVKAPKYSISLGSVSDAGTELAITIYAGGNSAYYARWVEFGTQSHSLTKNASVKRGLRQSGGRQHPGIAAQPFFHPAYRRHKRGLKSALARAVKRGIKIGAK